MSKELIEEKIEGDCMRMTSAKAKEALLPDDDKVNNPSHYQSMIPNLNIDAISCMRAAFGDEKVADFCICNALKYIYRHQSKNGKTDILKAIWYLNKYLELYEKETS